MNKYLEEAKKFREAINSFAKNQTDEVLINNITVFEHWNPNNVQYLVGALVQDDEKLYRCLQAHTSQENWKPANVPALFTRITVSDWEEWDDKSSYAKGVKVKHNGKKWISNVDNNIWEPGATGVYTWTEVVD